MSGKYNYWTPEEDAFLEDFWTDFKNEDARKRFLYKLSKVANVKRTYMACANRAHRLGLTKREADGLPTISDLAREFGVSDTAIRNLISRFPERFPVDNRAHATLLPEETQARLREWYQLPTVNELLGTIPKEEAAARLGVVPLAVNRLIRFGAVRAIKVGPKYRVYESSVQEVIALRERYGRNWLAAIKDRLSDEYRQFCALGELRNRGRRKSA